MGDEKEFLECVLNDSETSTVEGILSSEANCVDNKDFTDVRNLKKSDCELSGYTWVNEISKKDNYFNIIFF